MLNDKQRYETISLSYLPMLLMLHFPSSAFLSSLLQLNSLGKAIDFSPITPPWSLFPPHSCNSRYHMQGHTDLIPVWAADGGRGCLHRMLSGIHVKSPGTISIKETPENTPACSHSFSRKGTNPFRLIRTLLRDSSRGRLQPN